MKINLYCRPNCLPCLNAVTYLTSKSIQFEKQMLDQDFDIIWMGENFPEAKTFPIVEIDGRYIGGYTDLVALFELTDKVEEILNNGVCTIKFLKTNGELREMRCTRNLGKIDEEYHPKGNGAKKNEDIVTVFDLENNGWRSFNKYRLMEVSLDD